MVENKRLTLVFSIKLLYICDVGDERNWNVVSSGISESYYSATWGEQIVLLVVRWCHEPYLE